MPDQKSLTLAKFPPEVPDPRHSDQNGPQSRVSLSRLIARVQVESSLTPYK